MTFSAIKRQIRKGTVIRSESPLSPPMIRTVTRTVTRGYYFTWSALGISRNAYAEYPPARDVQVTGPASWVATMKFASIEFEIVGQPS